MVLKICTVLLFFFSFNFTTSIQAYEIVSDLSIEKHPTSTVDKIVIPFKLVGRLTIVEAVIDGKAGSFILDTGAPALVLNRRYFKDSTPSANGRSNGINGKVNQLYEQVISRMYWNGLQAKNILVDVIDMSHIEQVRNVKLLGLIGYQLFKKYELVFDYPNRQIMLYRLNKKGRRAATYSLDNNPADSIPITMIRHLPCIKKQIGGKPLVLGIDSGAEINLLRRGVHKKLKPYFTPMGETALHGLSKKAKLSTSGKLRQFWLDCLKYEDMITLFTDLKVMDPHYSAQLDGILGYEFLSQHKVAINFKTRQLYYWRNTGEDCSEKS